MKQITTQANITSLTAKVDGSLGMRVVTPELSNEEKTEFFNIQNKNVILTITPQDEQSEGEIKVSADMGGKTPSQRLRAVMYVYWKEHKQDSIKTFQEFYERAYEKLIDQYKEMID